MFFTLGVTYNGYHTEVVINANQISFIEKVAKNGPHSYSARIHLVDGNKMVFEDYTRLVNIIYKVEMYQNRSTKEQTMLQKKGGIL